MRGLWRLRGAPAAALLGLLLAVLVTPGPVSAHERRDLAGGKYLAVVGFLTEPAFVDQMNGLDLTITSKTEKTADGKDKPIEGLEKTLKAQVIVGGGAKMLDLELRTRFGMPGKYAAYFMPTKPGDYIFRVYGEIEGQRIDERFESGPGRFNAVEPLAARQFPEREASVPSDLQARLDAARSRADRAQLLGIAGLVVGALGLGLGAFAALRRPGASQAAGAAARPRMGEGD